MSNDQSFIVFNKIELVIRESVFGTVLFIIIEITFIMKNQC